MAKARQNLTDVHKNLRRMCKEEIRLLSVVPSDEVRGNGQKLKRGRLHLLSNIR